ncbi:MAG: ABC transporter permease [Ignavibacteriales bacterium]|nr:ABC transporter permease [Ignavibacteriales bacterium]
MFNTTIAIAKKEFKHLIRDKRLFGILIFFPVFLLAFFGYAVDFDVKNIELAVLDLDQSPTSRKFISETTSSEYFSDPLYINNASEIKSLLDKKTVAVVITIPENFDFELQKGNKTTIQYLVDGVNANSAIVISNYLEAAIATFNAKFRDDKLKMSGITLKPPVTLSPKFLYNPELRSTLFFIPGLISMILVITAVVSVSLSLVRETERNTIEQIRVSPVSTMSLLVGKILPYLGVAYLNAAMILVVGYFLFGVETMGSYFDLLYTTLIFLFACTSLGYLVSVISANTQIAFTLGTFISLLPSLILSGFIFQIESMPKFIQVMTNITPTKFFNNILRSIILRGTGIETFYKDIISLLLYISVVLVLSVGITKIKERKA